MRNAKQQANEDFSCVRPPLGIVLAFPEVAFDFTQPRIANGERRPKRIHARPDPHETCSEGNGARSHAGAHFCLRDFAFALPASTTIVAPSAVSAYMRRRGRFSFAEISGSSQRLSRNPMSSRRPSAR